MQNLYKGKNITDYGFNFSKNELIHVCFTSELKNFVAYCAFWQNQAQFTLLFQHYSWFF